MSFARSASGTCAMRRRPSPLRKPAKFRLPMKSSPASATPSSVDSRLLEAHPLPMDTPESAPEISSSELSFEDALKRLEEIVRTLERGEAPLDKSIELYQEGDKLKRHCEARLKAAQARIEQIAFGSDGKPTGAKPFDVD